MHLPDVAPMALWPSLLAVQAQGAKSAGHAHHGMHLVLCRSGELSVQLGDAEPVQGAGVWTAPDTPHAIDASDRTVVMLFVDPESTWGARLRSGVDRIRLVDSAERDALLTDLPDPPRSPDLIRWMERVTDAHIADQSARPMHPRVLKLVRELRELPPDADTSLEALATRVELSPSRLMHAFTESVGIPLRPYLRWLKVQRAAVAIVRGSSLSLAAAEAGFADASHMSRTFKRMFGLTPSALAAQSRAS